MGLKHRQHPTYGVQFHPESILTEHGKQLLKNFLDIKIAPPPSTEPVRLKPFIAKAINHKDLTSAEAEEALNVIMTGGATPAQIGAYLIALRMKGETIPEITGSVRAMRANMVKVKLSTAESIYDIVGTGGDGAHTFNISTAAAFVLAGTGRKVAKHGNRAASSQCGSADILSALGVNLDLTPDQVAQSIEQIGIGFMFAPKFHPAMKYAVGPRKEIGQRTIFNILGPLTNPAGANIQLTGVFDAKLTEPLAHVLNELGSKAALVIHGANGLDELNPTGVNRVSHLRNGAVETYDLNPADLGLAPATVQDLRGGTPDESAQMMRDLLSNKLNGARRDAVLLNAAAALAAETGDFKSALNEARAALNNGAALNKLNALIEFTKSV
jgi:anthranilate phosphoribosyltransferase